MAGLKFTIPSGLMKVVTSGQKFDFGSGGLVLETLSLTTGMLTPTGSFVWLSDEATGLSRLVDESTVLNSFYTTGSGGQVIAVDYGSAVQVETMELYVGGTNVSNEHVWSAYYSDDGSSWTDASATLSVYNVAGYQAATIGDQGSHRYWRLVKDASTLQMQWINELKMTAYV